MAVIEKAPVGSSKATLRNVTHPELRRLRILETETSLLVSGRVSTFFLKSIALEAAKKQADGKRIVLQIEVGG
jgi:hypothetical protein